ncbi:hypothetical protein O181_041287 [Austropuccinia psidii MF-1]|uniref:Uncharacterized protein n=1 Tax=Austropuccinia psidii MF-1 TaxID=1389203 RepID=A0A9Q3DKH0_9BASI|nr:hypothetical protein [Austropuccinia psidii MF-1]
MPRRLVPMILRSKSHADVNNPSLTCPNQSDNVPVLELSLPDSKAFRASLIFLDLARRFTMLRTNGELVSIDTFQQLMRHQRQNGQITDQDESILIHQYQKQYHSKDISNLDSFHHSSDSSTKNHPSLSNSQKPSLNGLSPLFASSSSERDAVYIQKKLNTSSIEKSKLSHDSNRRPCGFNNQLISKPTTLPSQSNLSNSSSSHQSTLDQLDSSSIINLPFNSLQPQIDHLNDHSDLEITPNQFRRISLAVDRIIDHVSNTNLNTKAATNNQLLTNSQSPTTSDQAITLREPKLDSIQDTSSSIYSNNNLDAKSRVQQELFKALSVSSSSKTSSSLNLTQPVPPTLNHSDLVNHPMELNIDSISQDCSFVPSINSPTISIRSFDQSHLYYSSFSDNTLCDDDSIDQTSTFDLNDSQFDHLPCPNSTWDRDQPIPYSDLTYDDLIFIQQALVTCATYQICPKKLTLNPPNSHAPFDPTTLGQRQQSIDGLQPISPTFNSFNSTNDAFNPSNSHEQSSLMPSTRTSSLQSRLRLAKKAGMLSFKQSTSPHQSFNLDNKSHPSKLGFIDDPGLNQLASPSSSMSPEIQFPLTPPNIKGFDSIQATIHSLGIPSPINSDNNIPSSTHEEPINRSYPTTARLTTSPSSLQSTTITQKSPTDLGPDQNNLVYPKNRQRPSVSRTANPLPTTLLFRDVEAQAVAANLALKKISTQEFNGVSKNTIKGLKKKSIRPTEIGAPTLLSASADLTTLPLAPTIVENELDQFNAREHKLHKSLAHVTDRRNSPTLKSHFTSKGSLKLRLKKKRPSELKNLSHSDTLDMSVTSPNETIESLERVPDTTSSSFDPIIFKNDSSTLDLPPNSTTSSLINNRHSREQTISPTSWKHSSSSTGRLKSLRKFLGRNSKPLTNLSPSANVNQSYEANSQYEKPQNQSLPPNGPLSSPDLKVEQPKLSHDLVTSPNDLDTQVFKFQQNQLYHNLQHITSSNSQISPTQLISGLAFDEPIIKDQNLLDSSYSNQSNISHLSKLQLAQPTVELPIPLDQSSFGPSGIFKNSDDRLLSSTMASKIDIGVSQQNEKSQTQSRTEPIDNKLLISNQPEPGLMIENQTCLMTFEPSVGAIDEPVKLIPPSCNLTNVLVVPEVEVAAVTTTPSRPWLELQQNQNDEYHSDYAASILDLYGNGSDSPAPSRTRISAQSCYSNTPNLSRPTSWLSHSTHLHPNTTLTLNRPEADINKNEVAHDDISLSKKSGNLSKKNSLDDQFMVMVKQLQDSTRSSRYSRLSRFGPNSMLLDENQNASASSFIKNIIQPGHGKLINGNPLPIGTSMVDDEDDEAEVWKKILDG